MPVHLQSKDTDLDELERRSRKADHASTGATKASVRPSVSAVSAAGTIHATCRLIWSVPRPTRCSQLTLIVKTASSMNPAATPTASAAPMR